MTRTIYVPDQANIDQISAKFDNGVLQINVPKVIKTDDQCDPHNVDIL